MSDTLRTQLIQAYNLIKDGQKGQAESLLIGVLRDHPTVPEAWWLLANALTDPNEQREALQEVLKLRPGDEKATKKLAKLNALAASAKPVDAFADLLADRTAPADSSFGSVTSPQTSPFGGSQPASPPAPPKARSGSGESTLSKMLTDAEPFDEDDPFAALPSQPKARAPKARASKPIDFDEEDPFAVVPSQPKRGASQPRAARSAPVEDDPFADMAASDDDPFAQLEPPKTARPRSASSPKAMSKSAARTPAAAAPTKSSTNPWLIAAVIIGALLVIGCFAVIFAVSRGINVLGQTMATMVVDPTFQAAMQSGGEFSGFSMSSRLESGLNARGSIIAGQPQRAMVDTFTDDSWTFQGSQGERYTVEIIATDGSLDPVVGVYGPDNQLIASNDDIVFGQNTDSRAAFALAQSGTYTIVVHAFGSGGSYEIRLTRN